MHVNTTRCLENRDKLLNLAAREACLRVRSVMKARLSETLGMLYVGSIRYVLEKT